MTEIKEIIVYFVPDGGRGKGFTSISYNYTDHIHVIGHSLISSVKIAIAVFRQFRKMARKEYR